MTEQLIIEQLKPADTDVTLSSNSNSKLPTQRAVKTYVDNRLKELGRFLSNWNCATGLPASDPEESPYQYKSGDHYIVSNVSTVNYRPSGSSYVSGVASTVVETLPVAVRDLYYYDGTTWLLLQGSQVEVAFANVGGSPYDNTSLAAALDSKVSASYTVADEELVLS